MAARRITGFFMDGLEVRRRRALYRAQHRGTKELDFMLGGYAAQYVPSMDESALTMFEHLLALPDPDIDLWIRGKQEAPEGVASVVRAVRNHLGLTG